MKTSFSLFISSLLLFTACGGGGGGGGGGGDGETATVTLTGQAAVRSSDIAGLRMPNALKASPAAVSPKFATIGDTALTNADVTLVKKLADGTETEVSTATTDTSGNYSLPDVPVCQTGTGTASDFYYEIRVTSGDLTVKAPACPSAAVGDEEVNVSLESDLAAKVISDVVNVPGTDDNPVPSPAVFAEVRDLTSGNVGEIEDSITIPSPTDSEESVNMANGMAAAGGDAEDAYKKFQFESEFVLMTAGEDIGAEEGASYLARIAKEGCQSSSATLPQAAAEAMADALTSGTTFTPAEIVEALNSVNGSDPDVDASAKVSEYADELAAIEEAESEAALLIKPAVITEETDLGVFLTKRDLTAADFSSSTELKADQAVAFLETLANDSCNFGNVSMTQVVGGLTGSSTLENPAIDNVVIYNDSGFGCNGDGQGHFRAQVDVYLPAGDNRTIDSVEITSTDGTALGGDGMIPLLQNGPGKRYTANQDGICVTIDEEVTYTITATLSDDSTVTDTVVRTHPQTMESVISMNGAVLPNGGLGVAADMRPLISWTPPEEIMADYAVTPPEGSQVKYTYEMTHYQLVGVNPDNQVDTSLSGTPGCQIPNNGASLYATSSMVPIADCDVTACAAAAGTTADKIYCQINIQTYLFDPFDQQQSQAAGAFRSFCVDTNGDDDCGE